MAQAEGSSVRKFFLFTYDDRDDLQSVSDYDMGKFDLTVFWTGKPFLGTIPKDVKLLVEANGSGEFVVALPMLEIAHWQVLVENEKREWRLNGAWNWPQEHAIQIKADPAPAGSAR